MRKLVMDFGSAELPDGIDPQTLLHGTGVQRLGERLSPGEMLLQDGVRKTRMSAGNIRRALDELGVSFEYISWNPDSPEHKDRLCFVKSLGGVLSFGKEVQT